MKFARSLSRLVGQTKSSASCISDAQVHPWTLIGEGSEHLHANIERLYWEGVERELERILLALKEWQSHPLAETDLPDEVDDFVHGFDTFIDQVHEDSRYFAEQVALLREEAEERQKRKFTTGTAAAIRNAEEDYLATLEKRTYELLLRQKSSQLKAEIRSELEEHLEELVSEPRTHRRTRMMLQALGLLDMEKLVEHRPPLDKLSFWKRPAFPQLRLGTYSKAGMPLFAPLQCSSCGEVIRSSMYRREFDASEIRGNQRSVSICEECYRKAHFGSTEYRKLYKHCILDDVITPPVSRKICMCEDVPHYSSDGTPLSLFPVKESDSHLENNSPGCVECGLFKFQETIAEAKYHGMRTITTKKPRKDKNSNEWDTVTREHVVELQTTNDKSTSRPKIVTEKSQQPATKDATTGTTVAVEEAEADEDIPFFLRQYTEQYPFGNVHMALRLGPIVVENGVANSKGGALISLRDGPVFTSATSISSSKRCLALSETRQLWWQERPNNLKRFKAVMKQVVGTPFTGVLDPELERKIINALVNASKEPFDDPGLRRQDRAQWLERVLEPILTGLKELLAPRLSIYLDSIVFRLLDSNVTLRWSPTANNCQNFCDNLIDYDIFSPLAGGPLLDIQGATENTPLYLLSFVTRPTGYTKPRVKSKFDVPRGLTEEYLLRFHFGRHDEADLIDSLQEYWYDWGSFGKNLYHYQDLFPWDCTEAFGRYPVTCGQCNVSKHIWAFPFDSWNVISLHLGRTEAEYPIHSHSPNSDQIKPDNRLLLLTAHSKLTLVAAALVANDSFRAATSWLHTHPNPSMDRVKLGGIHRAQPFSHAYDHSGRYKHFFSASWVHKPLPERIAEYELLRDGRVKLPDVGFAEALYGGRHVEDIVREYERSGPDSGMGQGAIGVEIVTVADSGWGHDLATADAEGSTGAGSESGGAANCGTGCGSSSACSGGGCGGGSSSGGGGGGGCGGGGGGGGGGGCGGGGGGCGGGG
ncbi:uncharacterized protein BDV14DRAFT_210461 [Aspergillus stella-maris]|uniref:uncharacterized protein n=1 Tax=Aspergillus stella-maris TaxID=1810926 RepID=UPI003CCDA836